MSEIKPFRDYDNFNLNQAMNDSNFQKEVENLRNQARSNFGKENATVESTVRINGQNYTIKAKTEYQTNPFKKLFRVKETKITLTPADSGEAISVNGTQSNALEFIHNKKGSISGNYKNMSGELAKEQLLAFAEQSSITNQKEVKKFIKSMNPDQLKSLLFLEKQNGNSNFLPESLRENSPLSEALKECGIINGNGELEGQKKIKKHANELNDLLINKANQQQLSKKFAEIPTGLLPAVLNTPKENSDWLGWTPAQIAANQGQMADFIDALGGRIDGDYLVKLLQTKIKDNSSSYNNKTPLHIVVSSWNQNQNQNQNQEQAFLEAIERHYPNSPKLKGDIQGLINEAKQNQSISGGFSSQQDQFSNQQPNFPQGNQGGQQGYPQQQNYNPQFQQNYASPSNQFNPNLPSNQFQQQFPPNYVPGGNPNQQNPPFPLQQNFPFQQQFNPNLPSNQFQQQFQPQFNPNSAVPPGFPQQPNPQQNFFPNPAVQQNPSNYAPVPFNQPKPANPVPYQQQPNTPQFNPKQNMSVAHLAKDPIGDVPDQINLNSLAENTKGKIDSNLQNIINSNLDKQTNTINLKKLPSNVAQKLVTLQRNNELYNALRSLQNAPIQENILQKAMNAANAGDPDALLNLAQKHLDKEKFEGIEKKYINVIKAIQYRQKLCDAIARKEKQPEKDQDPQTRSKTLYLGNSSSKDLMEKLRKFENKPENKNPYRQKLCGAINSVLAKLNDNRGQMQSNANLDYSSMSDEKLLEELQKLENQANISPEGRASAQLEKDSHRIERQVNGLFQDSTVREMQGKEQGLPTSINGFEFVKKLGSGSYGTAYLYFDPETQKMYAVKFPNRPLDLKMAQEIEKETDKEVSVGHRVKEKREGESALRGILSEESADALKIKAAPPKLGPNGQPMLYQNGQPMLGEAQTAIIQEAVGKADLEEILKGSVENLFTAVQVGSQIIGQVNAIHGEGFVHRDLKPANMRIGDEGVIPIDFGTATPEGSPFESIGSPIYMPPESFHGSLSGFKKQLQDPHKDLAQDKILFKANPQLQAQFQAQFQAQLQANPQLQTQLRVQLQNLFQLQAQLQFQLQTQTNPQLQAQLQFQLQALSELQPLFQLQANPQLQLKALSPTQAISLLQLQPQLQPLSQALSQALNSLNLQLEAQRKTLLEAQLPQAHTHTAAQDVYSMGLILAETLFGQLFYSQGNEKKPSGLANLLGLACQDMLELISVRTQEIDSNALLTEFKNLNGQLNPRYPDDVLEKMAGIIGDCLNVEPEKRPTAAEVYERWTNDVIIPMTGLGPEKGGPITAKPGSEQKASNDSDSGVYKHPGYGLSKAAQTKIDQAKQPKNPYPYYYAPQGHPPQQGYPYPQQQNFYPNPGGFPYPPQGFPPQQPGFPASNQPNIPQGFPPNQGGFGQGGNPQGNPPPQNYNPQPQQFPQQPNIPQNVYPNPGGFPPQFVPQGNPNPPQQGYNPQNVPPQFPPPQGGFRPGNGQPNPTPQQGYNPQNVPPQFPPPQGGFRPGNGQPNPTPQQPNQNFQQNVPPPPQGYPPNPGGNLPPPPNAYPYSPQFQPPPPNQQRPNPNSAGQPFQPNAFNPNQQRPNQQSGY